MLVLSFSLLLLSFLLLLLLLGWWWWLCWCRNRTLVQGMLGLLVRF